MGATEHFMSPGGFYEGDPPFDPPPVAYWSGEGQACVIGQLGFYEIGNLLYVAVLAPGSRVVITIDLEGQHETGKPN